MDLCVTIELLYRPLKMMGHLFHRGLSNMLNMLVNQSWMLLRPGGWNPVRG